MKDGGPAFPFAGPEGHQYNDAGMSLRDYFAAKVLSGFAANPAIFASNDQCGWSLVNCKDEDLVGYAYKFADTMIECRASKPQKEGSQ